MKSEYRRLAKQFCEADHKFVGEILTKLAAEGFICPSEADLQRVVMAALVERRRPKLNKRAVVVGLPYRDDQRGRAILEDANRVAGGTLCEVRILAPSDGMGLWSAKQIVDYALEHNFSGQAVTATRSLRALGIDAIYVSGGAFDHPGMTGGPRNQPKPDRQVETAQRHAFEEAVIRRAVAENLPVLGICGGSWRVASTLGLEIRKLNNSEMKAHNRSYNEPHINAHTVEVLPLSMLNQILQTDNYLMYPDMMHNYSTEAAVVNANSVHWAQSVVPITSPIQVKQTARAHDGVTEAFESTGSHFVMGVQWHPEYAMDGLDGSDDAHKHRQILRALGDAARDGRAATTLQKHYRAMRARRQLTALRDEKQSREAEKN